MKNAIQIDASKAGSIKIGGDLPVHRLGFGAMRITGQGIWGEPENPKEAKAVLHKAIDLGINFIDTADSYGPETSENYLADTLYPYPSDLVIATKGGYTRQGPNQWTAVGRPEYLIQCVEMSLRRLKLERIDLYQFHHIDTLVPLEESLQALSHMQRQGKIRHIGISNFTMQDIKRAEKVVKFVSVQNMYNVFERESEDVLKYCEEHKIAFIPYFPLGSGSFAQSNSRLEKLAKQKGATPMQIALAWLLKRSKAMLPIPGTSQVKHLEDNLGAVAIDLTDEEFNQLNQAS